MEQDKQDDQSLLDKAGRPAAAAMKMHPFYRGKMETAVKARIAGLDDLAVWYTPGVAEPCKAIQKEPDLIYEYTSKWNTIAVVSDGSRVLGLGDIGPKAALPVMEGKALLFKYLGGVDAVPLCLDCKEPETIIQTVLHLQPAFGGVNLEDIAQPKCFRILDELRQQAEIPIWHDDQQGTATVTLAGLLNALKIVGKKMSEISIAFIGGGAANIAISRLLFKAGVPSETCMMVDIQGLLGRHRRDIENQQNEFPESWQLCRLTNHEGRQGGIAEAMQGADVVIALSRPGPGVIRPGWIGRMAKEPIVFACANPTPEIYPWEARAAGAAVVATGRSDFPNQVNNSLGFPGIFRGALDVRAASITDEMCFAAAECLAGSISDKLDAEHLLPTMEDWEVVPEVAVAVALKAQQQGIARLHKSEDELRQGARELIERSRRLTQMMMAEGFIPEFKED